MFAVTIDRPYYPNVEYYYTGDAARRAYKELIVEEHENDGKCDVTVCLVKVIEAESIKTHF